MLFRSGYSIFYVTAIFTFVVFGCVGDNVDGGDSDGDVDADSDGDTDTYADVISECPYDMVQVNSRHCIDRYESSRGAGDIPLSVPNAMPWVNVSFTEATRACFSAGKTLCDPDEFRMACAGPDHPWEYSDLDSCNSVGGGTIGELAPTGSFPDCEGYIPGTYDLIGNVAEWVSSCDGDYCELTGGSFEGVENECHSLYYGVVKNRQYSDENIGFRCCLRL